MRALPIQLACALCAALSSPSLAQELHILGFEAGRIGDFPEGWIVPTEGWTAELTEERAAVGSRAVKLSSSGRNAALKGNLMLSTPFTLLAGPRVTLTARIFVVGKGQGQMWLRACRRDGTISTLDTMENCPIRAGDWQEARIEAEVDADATALDLGFLSAGQSTLYIDDVQLRIHSFQEPSPPSALSPHGLANLTAAAKLLSYVRFFHPSDEAVGVVSWDHFAVALVERCEPANDAADLAKRMNEAMQDIAPTVDIWPGKPNHAPPRRPLPAGTTTVAMWRHVGAGRINSTLPQSRVAGTITRIPVDSLPGGLDAAFVVKDLGAGVSCRIPIAVFANDTGTLPPGKTPAPWGPNADLPKLTATNRSTRLAGVAIAWGVFQHFYPYFDVVKTDWEAALPASLAKAAEDTSETEYLFTLREMVAKLRDGHGKVENKALPAPPLSLPLALEWVGRDLVVVEKDPEVPAFVAIGDSLVSIDGRPIRDCGADVSKWISAATDGHRRVLSAAALVRDYPTRNPAQLVFRKPNGRELMARLPRVALRAPNKAAANRPANGKELAPGVVYFDLDDASKIALDEAMPKLEAAKAIVFDLRGSPGPAGFELVRHLIDAPATNARRLVPLVYRPDREGFEWIESASQDLQPRKPRLKAPIAFLTDGRAISSAESVLSVVEHYRLGEIIGSTTAGTDGGVNPFKLPGGYIVYWTGTKVLKQDGSPLHGVGIAPTVPVTPTARGIAKRRDQVLEKAVEVMKAKVVARHKQGV